MVPSRSVDVEVIVTGSRGFGDPGTWVKVATGRRFATATTMLAVAVRPRLSVTRTRTV